VLTEVPIAVTAEGTYHQMGAFLQRMGQMPRIVSLGDFRMLGIDRGPGTVRAELTLATFRIQARGRAAAARQARRARRPPQLRRPRHQRRPAPAPAGATR
jgi:Tfp pilus assembly protein PilO